MKIGMVWGLENGHWLTVGGSPEAVATAEAIGLAVLRDNLKVPS